MDAHRHKEIDLEVDGEQLKQNIIEERCDSDYYSYSSTSSSIHGFRKEITQIMSETNKSRQSLDSLKTDSGFISISSEKSLDNEVESTPIHKISERFGEIKLESTTYSSIESNSSVASDRVTPEAMVVYGKDEDGDTLLNVAILEGQLSLVMEFIKLAPGNVWLDIQNNDLWQTPLHLAVLTKQTEIARRLLVGGADFEIQDCNGDTPLHVACRLGDGKMVSTLLAPIEFNETHVNEYQIPCRNIPQNLEIRNSSGYTCLHEAALNGHLNVVKILISKGANVNTKECKCGATILHMAIDRSDYEMVVYIISRRDANVDCKLYNGTTPMLLAHYRKNMLILDKLKRAGATFGNLALTGSPTSSEDDDM